MERWRDCGCRSRAAEDEPVGSRTKAVIWISRFRVNSVGHVFSVGRACEASLALGKCFNSSRRRSSKMQLSD